ncbi:MAG: hypothetical protein WC310_00295 [Patescibacteria group bacterium]|jgi:hypothetical protein
MKINWPKYNLIAYTNRFVSGAFGMLVVFLTAIAAGSSLRAEYFWRFYFLMT